jgi:hypothetical protein
MGKIIEKANFCMKFFISANAIQEAKQQWNKYRSGTIGIVIKCLFISSSQLFVGMSTLVGKVL